MGHYRENDSRKKVSALSNNSGWVGKERLTDQYRMRVQNGVAMLIWADL